jgi:hypothetical protein
MKEAVNKATLICREKQARFNEIKKRGYKSYKRYCAPRSVFNPQKNIKNIKNDNPRLFRIWYQMKYRCENKNSAAFKWYGSRGIKVYTAWDDFYKFYSWSLLNGYQDKLTIDRINNKRGYSPKNCQWITLSENCKKQHLDNKCKNGK